MFENIISIAFRIINFGIIVFIFVYATKKYLLKAVKERIFARNSYFQNLKKNLDNYINRSRNLDTEIIEQEQLSKRLINKIEIWNNSFENLQAKKIEELALIKEKINHKLLIQENNVTLDNIRKTILPDVIKKAQDKLTQDFESVQKKQIYQNELITLMKQSLR